MEPEITTSQITTIETSAITSAILYSPGRGSRSAGRSNVLPRWQHSQIYGAQLGRTTASPRQSNASAAPESSSNAVSRTLQAEHVHHRARISVFQGRGLRAGPVRADGDRDILLAVDRIADRRRPKAATG